MQHIVRSFGEKQMCHWQPGRELRTRLLIFATQIAWSPFKSIIYRLVAYASWKVVYWKLFVLEQGPHSLSHLTRHMTSRWDTATRVNTLSGTSRFTTPSSTPPQPGRFSFEHIGSIMKSRLISWLSSLQDSFYFARQCRFFPRMRIGSSQIRSACFVLPGFLESQALSQIESDLSPVRDRSPSVLTSCHRCQLSWYNLEFWYAQRYTAFSVRG